MNELDLYNQFEEEYQNALNRTEQEMAEENMDISLHNLDIYRSRFYTGLGIAVFIYMLNLNDIASFFDEPEERENFQLDISTYSDRKMFTLSCSYYF